ncbi:MAG: hypothetical protein ISS26_01435 [Candidatus Omnitrophica bacterium]|nr:hypothetical protein [Candidatus Omnitrophota bacterium]
MNIIFTSSGIGLKVFYSILRRIKDPLKVEKAGFYVAHSMYYSRFVKEHPDVESDYQVVKEWEILERSRKLKPDPEKISAYEKAIGNPTLWEPLVCDRRVYLGRRCKEKQDYRPSFTHEGMLGILQAALEEIEGLLDRVKPDLVFSLDPTTFGDYIMYLFCRARNIPMFFLRTTKIKNYVEFNDGMFGCSSHIYRMFQEYERNNAYDRWVKEAEAYLEETRNKDSRYEGMVLVSPERKKEDPPAGIARSLIRGLMSEADYLLKYKRDSHIPGIFIPFAYQKFILPFKARLQHLRYSRYYVTENRLDSLNFAFYPLQSEPEISSLIWGKSYMNQIETIRNIARSLPVGMKLLVKEHPRAVGYRSFGYYKKILQIPNTMLISPYVKARPVIKRAKAIISIATFVAFEAVIHRVPSIMLGGPRPFSILPDSMMRYVHSMNDLAAEINGLLRDYEYKERPLIHYIAATMRGSVPVNYFTTMLKKKSRYVGSASCEFEEEIEKLSHYTIQRVKEVMEAREVKEAREVLS